MTPSFETSAEQYAWLQQSMTIGIGGLTSTGAQWEVFAVNG